MALSPGEQALVAKGQPVTSSFIPAESRARINAAIQAQQSSAPVAPPVSVSTPVGTPPASTGGMLTSGQTTRTVTPESIQMPALSSVTEMSDPTGLIQSIYQSELGRTLGSKDADQGALDYWTSRLQSGATQEQIRREIEGTPEGIDFDVSGAYTGLLGRPEAEIDPEGQQYWTQQLQTGALTPEQMRTSFLQSEEFLGDIAGLKTKSPEASMIGAAQQGSIADLGTLFYNARKSGEKIPVETIELLGYSRTDDRQTAFEFAKGGQAYAEGLEALDQAIEIGDVNKAQEIRNALADEQGFYDYYQQNIATEVGQEAANLRNQTATGDVFGVGDPGKYVTTVLDRIGDATMDVVGNPYLQASLALFGGPIGRATSSIMQLVGTLDSGDDPSMAQWAAALAGTAELSGLEGGNWLDYVPEDFKETALTIKTALDEGWDEAAAAFQNATGVSTEKLAEIENEFRILVGDENIEKFEQYITGLGDQFNVDLSSLEELISGQFGSQQEQLDAVAAALAAERQPRFVAQRGYQPGLPVDTQFGTDERSLVMDVLNA